MKPHESPQLLTREHTAYVTVELRIRAPDGADLGEIQRALAAAVRRALDAGIAELSEHDARASVLGSAAIPGGET